MVGKPGDSVVTAEEDVEVPEVEEVPELVVAVLEEVLDVEAVLEVGELVVELLVLVGVAGSATRLTSDTMIGRAVSPQVSTTLRSGLPEMGIELVVTGVVPGVPANDWL